MFPIHFARGSHERIIRIVLECQPAQLELERLERDLDKILEPIPIRPRTVKKGVLVALFPGGGCAFSSDSRRR